MKKILMVVVTVLISIVAFGAEPQTPEYTAEQVTIRTRNKGQVHRAPGTDVLTFEGLLYRYSNTIVINASSVCDVTVEVLNLTTGQSMGSNATLGVSPFFIPLFGEGQYRIVITLASGQVYEGEFIL